MNSIKNMLQDQKDLKLIVLKNYFDNERDFLCCAKDYLSSLDNEDEKYDLDLLINTVMNGTNNNLFFLDIEIEDAPNYCRYFQVLIHEYFKDKEKSYRKAIDFWNTRKKMDNFINKFKQKYINASLFMPIIMDIAVNMEEKINRKKETTYVKKGVLNNYVEEDVVKDIYNSGLSLLDYAFYHPIDFTTYNNYISRCKNKKEIGEIYNRSDTVEEKILSVIKMISSREIDCVSYYEHCKLKPKLLQMYVKKYNLENPVFSEFIVNSFGLPMGTIQINKLYENELIIDDFVVPVEMKKQAIDYLISINAPTTYSNYNLVIRKLVNEKNVIKR